MQAWARLDFFQKSGVMCCDSESIHSKLRLIVDVASVDIQTIYHFLTMCHEDHSGGSDSEQGENLTPLPSSCSPFAIKNPPSSHAPKQKDLEETLTRVLQHQLLLHLFSPVFFLQMR